MSDFTDAVKGNMEGFATQQVKRAELAQELCHNMGPIAKELFKTQAQTNDMHNCPMTVDNIDNARKTFGKSMHALKGNCVRQQLKEVKSDTLIVPQELIANNHKTELCMDSVTIDGVSFLHSTDEMAKCCHATHMPRAKAEDCCEALDNVSRKCNKAGFVAAVIHCDQEFEPLMGKVEDDLSVRMSHTNRNKHGPTTEHDECT